MILEINTRSRQIGKVTTFRQGKKKLSRDDSKRGWKRRIQKTNAYCERKPQVMILKQ